MKILMLETMTYGDDISLEQFNRLGEVVTYSLSSYEEAVARMKEHNPDVVIINKTNMNAECMAAAPNLKMVAEAATGYSNIDIEYAKAHGIRVANVAGYSTHSSNAIIISAPKSFSVSITLSGVNICLLPSK